MKTFSALLAICAGNSPVPGEFPSQRPVTRSFDIFFDLRLNKRLSKQSWGWWFETLSSPLWRHSNDLNGAWPEIFGFGTLFYYYQCSHLLGTAGKRGDIKHHWIKMVALPSINVIRSLSGFLSRNENTTTLLEYLMLVDRKTHIHKISVKRIITIPCKMCHVLKWW